MSKIRNPLTLWATWLFSVVFILLLIAFMVAFSSCSSPFLKTITQAVNPTYTMQFMTLDGIATVKIPVELPDFITGGSCCLFEIADNIYGIKFKGVKKNQEGYITDYYILVMKREKPPKAIALRAVQMDTDRYWVYIKGIPIPASMDQVMEKIDWLIGEET